MLPWRPVAASVTEFFLAGPLDAVTNIVRGDSPLLHCECRNNRMVEIVRCTSAQAGYGRLRWGQLQQPAMPDAASCNSRYKQRLTQRIEGETELHVCSSMGRNSYEAMASTVSVGMQMRMDVWISQQ